MLQWARIELVNKKEENFEFQSWRLKYSNGAKLWKYQNIVKALTLRIEVNNMTIKFCFISFTIKPYYWKVSSKDNNELNVITLLIICETNFSYFKPETTITIYTCIFNTNLWFLHGFKKYSLCYSIRDDSLSAWR